MTLRDAFPAALIVSLATFVLVGTWDLAVWDGVTPGPGFFPRIVGVAGLALGAAEIVGRIREPAGEAPVALEGGARRRVGLTIVGLAAATALSTTLGMSSAVGLFVLFMLLVVLRRRPIAGAATALGVAVAIELLFVRWLGVPLPAPFFV